MRQTAVVATKCRCGTRLAPGGTDFEFHGVPELVRPILEGMPLCSPACARALLLETMEVLETPGSATLLRDVREVYWSLQVVFTVLTNQMGSGTEASVLHLL